MVGFVAGGFGLVRRQWQPSEGEGGAAVVTTCYAALQQVHAASSYVQITPVWTGNVDTVLGLRSCGMQMDLLEWRMGSMHVLSTWALGRFGLGRIHGFGITAVSRAGQVMSVQAATSTHAVFFECERNASPLCEDPATLRRAVPFATGATSCAYRDDTVAVILRDGSILVGSWGAVDKQPESLFHARMKLPNSRPVGVAITGSGIVVSDAHGRLYAADRHRSTDLRRVDTTSSGFGGTEIEFHALACLCSGPDTVAAVLSDGLMQVWLAK
jgi:hypothetical protein